MNKIQLTMLEGECWYAMDVSMAHFMPIDKTQSGEINLVEGYSDTQTMPLLISNHGRYIWCEDGFKLTYSRGKMTCVNEPIKHSIDLHDGFGTLRDAYLDVASKHLEFGGSYPDERLFRDPQYCTYVTMGENITMQSVLDYAEGIIESGMKPGILTIDYGWQRCVGEWEFDLTKIPQPKILIERLHEMGFLVRLWICPFVSERADAFRYLKYGEMLSLNSRERLAKRTWWHGRDAVLDLSNPDAVDWFKEKCDHLMEEYGIDGFKFEGGDARFYRNNDITYNAVDANTESMLYGRLAGEYPLSEIRACYKCSGIPIATRLCNKDNTFTELGHIVPSILLQGILGYPYGCADMVGGSEFNKDTDVYSGAYLELLIRSLEVSSLMPMMQFSLPIWQQSNKYVVSICRDNVDRHERYANYIMTLVKEAARTGEPIVRYMEYEYPHQGYHMVNDMFMLGSRYLVAPIVEAGKYTREVRLPKGLWEYVDGKIYEGTVTVDVPLEVLPIFERVR